MSGATVSNAMFLDGTSLTAPDGTAVALEGTRLRVGHDFSARGLRCRGELRLVNAEVGGSLYWHEAVLEHPSGSALHAHDLRVGAEADLGATFAGAVELDHAQVTSRLSFRGATLPGRLDLRQISARELVLAGERHRRESLPVPAKVWGLLQDVAVGYGYSPSRALALLVVLIAAGTLVFGLHPPRAVEKDKAPAFNAFAYTVDLILPGVDLGQQPHFHATGGAQWLAYVLILGGLLLATTVAAAVARHLRRS